jgi:hypothetical protein
MTRAIPDQTFSSQASPGQTWSDQTLPAVLPTKAQIQGNQGLYEVEAWLGQRGRGRLYRGRQLPDNRSVVIRELWLPEDLNPMETRQRRQAFVTVAGLGLADGRAQDSRLILPLEAIADLSPDQERRHYLISRGEAEANPTLGHYLATTGAMPGHGVRRLLNQALQTLQLLHEQKFTQADGQLRQRLVHGKLSLETLLIQTAAGPTLGAMSTPDTRATESPEFPPDASDVSISEFETAAVHQSLHDRDFLVYLCDLHLWEQLFEPAAPGSRPPTVGDDLRALGAIALYALQGGATHPDSGYPLDPTEDSDWPEDLFPPLLAYLKQLCGVSGSFPSAAAARQALLNLPPEPQSTVTVVPPRVRSSAQKRRRWWLWALVAALLLLLGIGLFWLLRALLLRAQAQSAPLLCCVDGVTGVPGGNFTYTAETDGTWSYVRQLGLIEPGKTLDQVLQDRLTGEEANPAENLAASPNNRNANGSPGRSSGRSSDRPLQLRFVEEPSLDEAIAQTRQGTVDFAVAGVTEPLPIDLDSQVVGYDGLVVFVAFSYAQRQNGLPATLNGEITLEQLQQIYTGQVTNWRQLGGPNLPVRPYAPDDPEAVRIFEQRVLGNQTMIDQFRQQLAGGLTDGILTLPTFPSLTQIIRDFEELNLGSISFGRLSQVAGQCSVYPLAIAADGPAVQPLVVTSGQDITPETDLCDAKGSYGPEPTRFRQGTYPLAYPVTVVSLRDNRRPPIGRKFAEILQTVEAQQLLNRTGLVPLLPQSALVTEQNSPRP